VTVTSKEHADEATATAAYVALGGAMFGPIGLIIAGLSAVIGKAVLKEEEDNTVESPEEAWERRRKWLDEFEGRQAAYDAAIREWLETGRQGEKPVPPPMSAMDKWRLAYYRAERAKRWAKRTAAEAKEGWQDLRDDWRVFSDWFWENYDRGVNQAERDRANGEPWWFVQARPSPTVNPNIFDSEPVDAEVVEPAPADADWQQPFDAEVVDPTAIPVRTPAADPRPAPGGSADPEPPPAPRMTPYDPDGIQYRSGKPDYDPYHSRWSGVRPDWTTVNDNSSPPSGGGEHEQANQPPIWVPSTTPPIRVPSTTPPSQSDTRGTPDMAIKQLAPSGSGRGLARRPGALTSNGGGGLARAVTGSTGVGVQRGALDLVQTHQMRLDEVLNVATQMARILRDTAAAAAEAASANAASTATHQANDMITTAYDKILGQLLIIHEDTAHLREFFRQGDAANAEEQAVLDHIRAIGADGRYFSNEVPQHGV
jgi:hypothetical protein